MPPVKSNAQDPQTYEESLAPLQVLRAAVGQHAVKLLKQNPKDNDAIDSEILSLMKVCGRFISRKLLHGEFWNADGTPKPMPKFVKQSIKRAEKAKKADQQTKEEI